MSYRSGAMMQDVLSMLDETLIPPELLALQKRSDNTNKVSGASKRLYDEDALQKKVQPCLYCLPTDCRKRWPGAGTLPTKGYEHAAQITLCKPTLRRAGTVVDTPGDDQD